MINRCILIFPNFPNIGVIEEIREKYDPVARLVRPHVTLVFPFESDLGCEEIAAHIRQALAGLEPFTLSLQGITAQRSFGNYLLLDVHKGRNKIRDMHTKLYTGILAQYKPLWCNPECRPFTPHMTVGKIDDDARFAAAVQAIAGICDLFETCVDEIAVEIISQDGGSVIESVLKLPVK